MKKIIVLFLILAAQSASAQFIMTGEGGGSSGGGGDDKSVVFTDPSTNLMMVSCKDKTIVDCPKCSIEHKVSGRISDKTISAVCNPLGL